MPQLDPKVPLETLVSEMAIYEGGYPKYVEAWSHLPDDQKPSYATK